MKQLFNKLIGLQNDTWQNRIVIYSIKIVVACVVLLIGFWLINRVSRLVNGVFGKRHIDPSVKSFFKTLLNTALKVILVIFILNFIGIQTTSIVALIGAAGLAIGLALQGTLTNFAGGVMILLFKPFRIGDTIEAQGKKGQVRDIQIFTTILTTEDDQHQVIIPNSILSNGIIENHGRQTPVNKT